MTEESTKQTIEDKKSPLEEKFAEQSAKNQLLVTAKARADRDAINQAAGFEVQSLTFLKGGANRFATSDVVEYHLKYILFEEIPVTITEEEDQFTVVATNGRPLRCLPFIGKDILADGAAGADRFAPSSKAT